MSVKIVSWNIAGWTDPWNVLADMDADIGLLQEAGRPPQDIAERVEVDPAPWSTAGMDAARTWRTAVVRLSDRVAVDWIEAKPLDYAGSGELAVSRLGTLTAARVEADGLEPFTVVSMYSLWSKPHASFGNWSYADASAHRLISDLSAFVGSEAGHRIVAAGDLNILHGYGDHGSHYWASRYGTVFDRMEALGLRYVGPSAPHGLQADPWPDELPRDSGNVPDLPEGRPGRGDAPARLRLRLQRDGRLSKRTRPQRPERVGTQRPLSRGDRGLVRASRRRPTPRR